MNTQPKEAAVMGACTAKRKSKDLTPPRGWEYFGKRDAFGIRQMRHIATKLTTQEWDNGR